jgi:hypothetical protein
LWEGRSVNRLEAQRMDSQNRARPVAVAACVALLGGMVIGGGVADAAKKGKKRGPKTVKVANGKFRAIPDAISGTASTVWGALPTRLNVPKRYKGVPVGDVRVTLRTTGFATDAASNLAFRITAPNGRTVQLEGGFVGQSIGPLTVTANSRTRLCGVPPCPDPDATLSPPYFGTLGDPTLALLDGVGMGGRWVVTVYDQATGTTSALNSVGLVIAPR